MFCNMLLDELPSITPNGFEINTDFRISIQFELLMQNNRIKKENKIKYALNLYYSKSDKERWDDILKKEDLEKAIEDMIWFYACGEELANSKSKKEKKSNKQEQIYSYEFDDDYIYSAFMDQYHGLDLNDVEHLHWWKFKAMFNGLKKDTKIVEIMGYRAMDLSKIKDKETKVDYKRLKNIYALPDMRTEEEKEKDFGNSFW